MTRSIVTSAIRKGRLDLPLADLFRLLDMPPPQEHDTMVGISVWCEHRLRAGSRNDALIVNVDYTEAIASSKEEFDAQS